MTEADRTAKIGAHVSVAGGLANGVVNAERIGARTIQIFGASPRRWSAPMPPESDVKRFIESRKLSSVGNVYLHASYLVNLASESSILREKSIACLAEHLRIGQKLGAIGVVFHMGSATDRFEGINRTIKGVKRILESCPGETMLLMENSAGGGNKLCHDCGELGQIMREVSSPLLKICFDTSHGFEAGILNFTPESIKNVFTEWDDAVGLKNIRLIHANDSKTPFNSKRDRHENIGEGYIGVDGFENLAHEKRLEHADWILEVPGLSGTGPDRENIDALRKIFQSCKVQNRPMS